MRRSIRLRLTLWYVGVLASTLVALGLGAFFLMRAALYDWLDDGLRERATLIGAGVQFDIRSPDRPQVLHYPGIIGEPGDAFLLLNRFQRAVQMVGMNGSLVVSTGAVTSAFHGRADIESIGHRPGGESRIVALPIVRRGRVVAVVVVVRSLRELHEVQQRLILVLFALSPIALIGAGLGGFLLAGRVLQPVGEITQAAAAITEHHLSRRLPVGGNDELGRLAMTFNQLIHRLAQALERQSRFTADASHELRTPLAIICAITSQKLMRPRTPEEYERAIRQIDEAARYMRKLVGHLLVLARAEAGQIELDLESVDLGELLHHAASQIGESVGRDIPVLVKDPATVRADPVQLTRLFMNLLENSVRHTPPNGTVEVVVSRVAAAEQPVAEVAVKDSGEGVSPDHLPHIFERFYRVDKARARQTGGAGLGLSIGKWVVEAHGGTIHAESSPGSGTTMTVRLPVKSLSEGAQ